MRHSSACIEIDEPLLQASLDLFFFIDPGFQSLPHDPAFRPVLALGKLLHALDEVLRDMRCDDARLFRVHFVTRDTDPITMTISDCTPHEHAPQKRKGGPKTALPF